MLLRLFLIVASRDNASCWLLEFVFVPIFHVARKKILLRRDGIRKFFKFEVNFKLNTHDVKDYPSKF